MRDEFKSAAKDRRKIFAERDVERVACGERKNRSFHIQWALPITFFCRNFRQSVTESEWAIKIKTGIS
jgi:hypothetical protein